MKVKEIDLNNTFELIACAVNKRYVKISFVTVFGFQGSCASISACAFLLCRSARNEYTHLSLLVQVFVVNSFLS